MVPQLETSIESLSYYILHVCMGTTLNPSEPQFAHLKTGILTVPIS